MKVAAVDDAFAIEQPKGFSQRALDGIERLGNKVPHPVLMFLYLIAFIAVLSAILAFFDISVTEEVAVPVPIQQLEDINNALGGSIVPYDVVTNTPVEIPDYIIREETIAVRSLLNIDGLRFIFTSFVNNFAGFGVIAVTLVAMAGVGAAEHAGLMAALIRKLVAVAPRKLIAFILIFVGVLSSVATDAGYLILIPLSASAFLTLGRHPLAGLAAAFAGVGAIFGVNILITPVDAMVTEITNEAIGTAGEPLTITANYFFSVVSSVVIAIVAYVITVRLVEPRLGTYDLADAQQDATPEEPGESAELEARGLRAAFWALVVVVVAIAALSLPPGAPLREPTTGSFAPLLDSLIFIISLIFLVCGIAFGRAAKTMTTSGEVIAGVTKMFSGLAGLIFMLLMISQFIAFLNYTNMARVAAIEMAGLLEQADIGAIWLLVAMILILLLLDIILPGLVPKWAIFAPVFIPIFIRLNVAPQTVLAAYRIGDSPINVVTPLMVYLPFMVVVAQRYKKDAGLGTIVALMLPYVIGIAVAWIVLFVVWFMLGIPLGPGYPVTG